MDAQEKSTRRSPEVLDDGADGCCLGFDTFGKLELHQCPGKIVFLILGLEIDIALQIVSKVSQPKFEGDQPDRVIEIFVVVLGEEVYCQREIALEDGLAKLGFEVDLLPVLDFFSQGVATRAETVTNIVMNQTRLDGVQINNADSLSGGHVHHDIIDFGIAVNCAELKLTTCFGIFEDGRPGSSLTHKF